MEQESILMEVVNPQAAGIDVGSRSHWVAVGQSEQDVRLLKSDESYRVGMRLQTVYQVALGHSSRELAALNNISFKQVITWVHRFEEEGIEGLKDKKGGGRKPLLNDEKMDRIKSMLISESPEGYGYKAKRWTGPLLTKWIKEEYGIGYEKVQVYNLLGKLGFSFRKKRGLVYEGVD